VTNWDSDCGRWNLPLAAVADPEGSKGIHQQLPTHLVKFCLFKTFSAVETAVNRGKGLSIGWVNNMS